MRNVIHTAIHWRLIQDCFIRPGPPNFFISLQKWHSPQSALRHASHFLHLVLLRRALLELLPLEPPDFEPLGVDDEEGFERGLGFGFLI